jgi:hypothetical protein
MTAARILAAKPPLTNRSSTRHVPARVVALHPWRSARAKLPFNAFPLGQMSPITPKQQVLLDPARLNPPPPYARER